jgi:hypothetical protein
VDTLSRFVKEGGIHAQGESARLQVGLELQRDRLCEDGDARIDSLLLIP